MNSLQNSGHPERVFIAWTQISRRSEELARHLGAEYLRMERVDKPFWKIGFRLVINFIQTYRWLVRFQPGVIITFHAHPFVTLCAALYCTLHKSRYFPDVHSAGFMDYNFTPIKQLSRYLWLHAGCVIVHNRSSATVMAQRSPELSAHLFVLEDPIPELERIRRDDVPNNPPVCTYVCRFSSDEPYEQFIAAAKKVDDLQIYITGNYHKTNLDRDALQNDNIQLTGFLSDSDYIDLLNRSDFLCTLTTRPHTLQSAGYEALALTKPVIVSDTHALRQYFGEAALYTDNSVESIGSTLQTMKTEWKKWRIPLTSMVQKRKSEWSDKIIELSSRMDELVD